MKKFTKIVLAILILCVLGTANFASAQLITIGIEATVNSVTDPCNLLEGKVGVGSTITGTYTYDTSTLDTNPFSWAGEYFNYGSLCGISLTADGFSFKTNSANTNFLVGVVDNYLNYLQDYYGIRSYNNLPLSNGVEVDHISWQLEDHTGTAVSSTALPTDAPVLSNWQYNNNLSISGGLGGIPPCYENTFYIEAEVTSAFLIPEPTSLFLFGFGLLTLRKKRL